MTDPSNSARTIPILVNAQGGTARAAGDDLAETLTQACKAAGIRADIQLLQGEEISGAVKAQSDQPLVIVGGGDGTLRNAAATLLACGSTARLGILPLGTHNHLAKQLRIPSDLAVAIEIAVTGKTRKIDVGAANDTIFLNNASIGLYPQLVRSREVEQHRHGEPKWMANVVAARAVLRRLRHHTLRLQIDGTARSIRTPLLFVGNNIYSLESGHVGERASLDEGILSVFAVASTTRLTALWFALRVLVGRANAERDFATIATTGDLTISAHARELHVALDGEVETFPTPLHFAIKQKALTVMCPLDSA